MKNLSISLSDFFIKIITFDYFVIKKVLKENVKDFKKKNVLDMGCGTGALSYLFSQKKYLGFDIDEESIRVAKKIHPGYKFQKGDATKFNLGKKYDLVIIIGVIHHLSNAQAAKAFSNVKKHLKKDGMAVVVEAIPPISKMNFLGRFLRFMDRGDYVRDIKDYRRLVKKDLSLSDSYEKKGGLVDYGILVAKK